MKNQDSDYNYEEILTEFEQLSKNFNWTDEDFNKVYDNTIKPIAESPYMFNYYHWITNFKEMKIIQIHGVKKILGYDEETFDMRKSWEIIHPNYRDLVLNYARIAYSMLSNQYYKKLTSKAQYSIQFPVLKNDGEYLLVQMNVSIIMTDREINPLVNYNRFEVLGKYFGAPIYIKPNVQFRTGLDLTERAIQAENELLKSIREYVLKHLGFTERELQVVIAFGTNKSLDEIAEELKMTVGTLKKHNRKILLKAYKKLSEDFRDAREVAIYLRDLSII